MMTGTSPGVATAPTSIPRLALRLFPSPPTRTRLNHGALMVGDQLATIDSSRRAGEALPVTLTVGAGSLQLTGAMTPTQARTMAKALTSAADAVERQQQGGTR